MVLKLLVLQVRWVACGQSTGQIKPHMPGQRGPCGWRLAPGSALTSAPHTGLYPGAPHCPQVPESGPTLALPCTMYQDQALEPCTAASHPWDQALGPGATLAWPHMPGSGLGSLQCPCLAQCAEVSPCVPNLVHRPWGSPTSPEIWQEGTSGTTPWLPDFQTYGDPCRLDDMVPGLDLSCGPRIEHPWTNLKASVHQLLLAPHNQEGSKVTCFFWKATGRKAVKEGIMLPLCHQQIPYTGAIFLGLVVSAVQQRAALTQK